MAINSGSVIFKKVFAGKASADNSRAYYEELTYADAKLGVFSTDVWSEAGSIPNSGIGSGTGSTAAGSSYSSGVVTYYSASGFGHINGTTAGYSSSVQDWIPFNFGDGTTYDYKLTKNDGTVITTTDPSDWTFDTEAGVLIFHDGNPDDVDADYPPSMSAYAYRGTRLSTNLVTGNITASENISGSATSTGSFGRVEVAGQVGLDGFIYHNGDSDTYFGFDGNDSYELKVGNM